MLAREHLNFICKKDEADYLYSLLRCLKRTFLYRCGNLKSTVFSKPLGKDDLKDYYASLPQPKTSIMRKAKVEVEDCEMNQDCSGKYSLSYLRSSPAIKLAEKDISKSIKEIQKKCQKQWLKLLQKQKEEKNQLMRQCGEEKAELQKKQRMEAAIIRSILQNNDLMRTSQLKILDDNFAKRLEKHEIQMDMRLQHLEAKQLVLRNKMKEREACWVEEVKSWVSVELLGNTHVNEPWYCLEHSEANEQFRDQVVTWDISSNSEEALIILDGEVQLEVPDDLRTNLGQPLHLASNSPREKNSGYAALSLSDGKVSLGLHATLKSIDGVNSVPLNPLSSVKGNEAGAEMFLHGKEVQVGIPVCSTANQENPVPINSSSEEMLAAVSLVMPGKDVQKGMFKTVTSSSGVLDVLSLNPLLTEEIVDGGILSVPDDEILPVGSEIGHGDMVEHSSRSVIFNQHDMVDNTMNEDFVQPLTTLAHNDSPLNQVLFLWPALHSYFLHSPFGLQCYIII